MGTNRKYFSIVIPIYNSTRLKRALASIESQKCLDEIEVVLVDDGSRDKSYKELLQDTPLQYRLIENTENKGPGIARQMGLEHCTGEWVTFLDHDDEFSRNCFEEVRDSIQKTRCNFMLVTDSLVADDYDWVVNRRYHVNHSVCVLHGKFYNRAKLIEYGIHFSPRLRAQEDTFFCTLVEGHASLDPGMDECSRVEVPVLTYFWYLWKDSTSHKTQGGISYLENTFDQYIAANFDAYKILNSKYHNAEFRCNKLLSLLAYCYWFFESFRFFNPTGYKPENLDFIRSLKKDALRELGLNNNAELAAVMLSRPGLYHITYETMATATEGPFIPQESMVDFIRNL